jgi:uncharacterized membrane protein
MNLIRNTILGGLVFLVPVVIGALVIGQAIEVMLAIAEPMADYLPVDSIAGIALANVIAGIMLILLCFLAGLLARTASAQRIVGKAEGAILQNIPGYTLIKGFTSSLSPDKTAHMKPVLVSRGYTSRVGLEVERTRDNRVAVYFPGSPNAWSGIVEIVADEQVAPIDKPIAAVFAHAEGLGRGTKDLLGRTNNETS